MSDGASGVRVLLVEDHPDVAEVTLLMLRHLGADAVHAETVAQAVTLGSQQEFDLLLADMRLPDGTGLEVIRRLCGEGAGPRPILLTAYGANDILPGGEGLEFERMGKPLEMDKLQAMLAELAAGKA